MERKAVGITGKLWRKISREEIIEIRKMTKDGFSFRDIGLKLNRSHKVVSYALKDEREKLLKCIERRKKWHERRYAKTTKPVEVVRLNQKLTSCIQQARKRAERKKIPINIDMKFLVEMYKKQNGLCALTGIKMETTPRLLGRRTNPYSVSLDRIDSKNGYVQNNVRLVIWFMNWAIGEWGESLFKQLIKIYLVKNIDSPIHPNY